MSTDRNAAEPFLQEQIDKLVAENKALVEALTETQQHLDARPEDFGLDVIRQKNSALLAKVAK